MAVDTAEDHTTEPVEPSAAGAGRDYARRIGRALLDLLELEVQIIILRLLAPMRDAVVRACFAAAGIVLGLAGLAFLEIAVFQAVERLIPLVWVFFVFAVAHLLLAGGAVFLAARPIQSGRSGAADMSSAPDKIGGARS